MANTRSKGLVVVLAKGVNGLGVVRSLHVAGYEAVVVAPDSDDLAMHSNLPVAKYVLPITSTWQHDVQQLLQELRFSGKPAVVACFDLAATFLAEYEEVLRDRYSLLVPDAAIVRALNDKRLELELMVEKGIRIPASITRLEELNPAEDFDAIPFPMLIKPSTQEGIAVIRAKNILVKDALELRDFYRRNGDHLKAFVMQEVISGGDRALWLCSAAFDRDSNMIAAFTYQRLGAMPFHYGVTSIGESRPNDRIKALVAEVGRRLGCVGPNDLEFMHDARTDEFLYIEINPRIGMCNWFDTSSGVNVIGACCDAALGITTVDSFEQRPGVIFVNLLGDLSARLEVSRSPLEILRFYWSLRSRPKAWAVYRRGDVVPAMVSLRDGLIDLSRRAVRLLLKRLRSRRSDAAAAP